jgi:hypothetical protein
VHVSSKILEAYISGFDELVPTNGAFLKFRPAFGTYVMTLLAEKYGRYHVLLARRTLQLSHEVIHD